MKNRMKRTAALLACFVLLLGMVCVPMEANAANLFYGDYTDAGKVYDYGSCPSMQGLAVGSQMMYTVKIGSNDSLAVISMTDKDTGTTTRLYNSDAGSYYFGYLGHANDMDVWGIDGNSHLFVTTTNTGSNAIVRLKRVGNTLTKVASYSLTYNGSATCATALAIKSVSNGVITFITKLGMNLYTGSVSTSATSANIALTKLCTISKSRVYIKGSYLDLSNFVNQGFGYYKDTLFVPITGDSTQLNRSVILVFDLRNASGTIYPTEALVFRVTSSYYSALFEIESCDICSGDGKLYFNTNRRRTTSDTNHDGVSSVDGYTFETLPLDAPTSAPKFTLRYNANGGSGTMADTQVTYGIATALRANAFTRPGYTFQGWTAYRTAQGQWRYQSADGSAGGWYAEGSQPAGYTKYIYKNKTKVSATTAVADDVVQLYAQWEQNKYTVTFADEDGTVLKTATATYGQVPTAPADPVKASDGLYSYTFAGWSPAVGAITGNTTYTATYTATLLDNSTATGSIPAYLDRVDSASELQEGVPYVISDYKDTWLHYVLTSQAAQKVSGSKTHQGFLLDGEPSVDTTDLWYIKDGYLVYGSADSSRYLNVSYDSANQGNVVMGSFNATTSAYVEHRSGDDFAIRSSAHFLNRYGGTANDFVAAAYTSAGGSYWHLDRLVPAKTVKLKVNASQDTILAGNNTGFSAEVLVDGIAAQTNDLTWTTSDSSVATVSPSGVVSGLKAGTVTITATITEANGSALAQPISVETTLTVQKNIASATGTVGAYLEKVSSLQTGVPYVITEAVSGAALTGDMLYTTSTGYVGLNGVQGLKTVSSFDVNDAPVWYYDGARLLWGSPTGSDNYLVYNSSNQVALGAKTETNVFDKVVVYSSSQKTFNIYPSNKGTGNYINQLGGSKYNVAGLYSSAYYSRWHFSRLVPAQALTMTVTPGNTNLVAGKSLSTLAQVTCDGTATDNYTLTWSSSDSSVAVVSSTGVITANGAGTAVITGTLTAVNGRAVEGTMSVSITVNVTAGTGYTATAVEAGQLVKVDSLKTGVPYAITESVSGNALSGDMLYTTSTGYAGLSGTQGLKLVSGINANNAPVWYYDGTHLLYGSATGSDNYLVYNAAGQVALGAGTEANIFDTISLYSGSNKTFTLYPSGRTSGSTNYYLNQLGGSSYNVVGLWSSASTSQWQFSEVIPEKTINLTVTPGSLTKGQSSVFASAVTVNGVEVSGCSFTWTSSDASVATVSGGTVTAVDTGSATITVTLTAAQGTALSSPITLEIPVTVA